MQKQRPVKPLVQCRATGPEICCYNQQLRVASPNGHVGHGHGGDPVGPDVGLQGQVDQAGRQHSAEQAARYASRSAECMSQRDSGSLYMYKARDQEG